MQLGPLACAPMTCPAGLPAGEGQASLHAGVRGSLAQQLLPARLSSWALVATGKTWPTGKTQEITWLDIWQARLSAWQGGARSAFLPVAGGGRGRPTLLLGAQTFAWSLAHRAHPDAVQTKELHIKCVSES